jgi:hypothetical protein
VTHRLTCTVRLRRPAIAYAAVADLPIPDAASRAPLALLDLACTQLFARAVLDQGGQIEVIVPAARYRDSLSPESHADHGAPARFHGINI